MIKQVVTAFMLATAAQPLGFAHAQQQGATPSAAPLRPDVSDLRKFDDFEVPQLGVTVDRLEDMDIVDRDGKEIGEVEDVLVDGSGRIVAVAVEIGRFLGIGDREVVIGIDQLSMQSDRRKLMVSMTREQLESLPRWED